MPLQAFVLRFSKICFLSSRCSTEMWCLDDTGRDSWDWVGPPPWEGAWFNSPERGGGSSPVKNGTSAGCCCCWLLMWLLLFLLDLSGRMSMSTSAENEIVQEPTIAKNSSPSGLRKLVLNSGTTRRSAKNDIKRPKNHCIAATTTTARSCVPVSVANWNVHWLRRWNESGALPLSQPSLHDHRDERTVDELHQRGHRPLCQSTATAGPSQFSALWHPASVVAHNGHATTVSMLNGLQLWELDCLLTDCCTTDIEHLVNELQLENLNGFLTEMSTTLTRRLRTWRCTITGMSRTGPRAAPEESRRRTAQFALWVLVSAHITGISNHCRWTEPGAPSSQSCWKLSLHGLKDVHRRGGPQSRRPPPPPQPRHRHTAPPSEPIGLPRPLKKFSSGASTPEPELDLGAPSPCWGRASRRSRWYGVRDVRPRCPRHVIIWTSITLYRALADT